MSNYLFIKSSWPEIFTDAQEAEQLASASPRASAIFCRSAIEKTILWLYANDADLKEPYNTSLSSLMHEACFRNILKPSLFREINLIRKLGNNAAHGSNVSQEEALILLKNLYRFLSFLAIYYSEIEPNIPPFNEDLIPQSEKKSESLSELQLLEKQLEARNEASRLAQEDLQKQAEEIESLKQQLKAKEEEGKKRREKRESEIDIDKAIPLLVSEQRTRKLYIDQSLKEAGWNVLREGYELEYEVKGMPVSTNPSGIGYVDYVLWGDNGKPLAVVEAKKTIADPRKGKQQAKLYADCLEAMHGQRPLIFYSNGFDTYLWDDRFYPEREVSGFYTKDELQMAVDRREARKDLRNYQVNQAIAGRYYQVEAVKRVAENLCRTAPNGQITGGSRKSLLVMATGSGKTRTAISIVDMLTKCNWAKRILFLADRNALVSQAKRRFNEILPNLSAIDLTKEKEEVGTRLVFSTYPTIMNKIDAVRSEDERFYGPGHFDLIIIDEAHRSVYQKYGAIFEYFDSLLIGLTATPKKEIDRNTYELFEIENDVPTFAYELDQAVADKFLVPPKAFSIPIKFPRDGVKYSDLSENEKAEYEEKFGDPSTGEVPDFIGGDAINQWLFNTDTVDKVLHYLMENGIKVQGGDRLGKTIIFAKSHDHAVFIEDRFNKNYPEYRGDFLRVIDNYETKAQDLLERFCDEFEETDPQIAVSVDMMDTGVDAPRVLNLVFFKIVRSYTKFWQMIGRGTRLCPDLFGPGEHKSHFLIIDVMGNLEFFEENPEGVGGNAIKSLTQRIFELKLDIALTIRNESYSPVEDRELAEQYIESLWKEVKAFDRERFVVKAKLQYVVEFSDKPRWENISMGDSIDIKKNLAPLTIQDKQDHELARRFDILVLALQVEHLKGKDGTRKIETIVQTAKALQKKMNIPMVAAHEGMLKLVGTANFWENITPSRLEEVRVALRELIKFLERENQVKVYTAFEDEIFAEEEHDLLGYSQASQPYRDRVEAYIRNNPHHLTIQKLRRNEPITADELSELERLVFDGQERGTKEEFEKQYGKEPLGQFIRKIVGMDINAAREAFAEFLQAGNLNAYQISFIDYIIKYLATNGVIQKKELFNEPFTDLHDQGLMGVFDDAQSVKVISIIDRINRNAEVG